MMDRLVTLTVNSTNFYLVDCLGGKLLIDAGWELPRFTGQLKQKQISPQNIRYIMFTHTHPDHAGLVQSLKEYCGARLIIHENQIPYLKDLAAFFAKKGGYRLIQIESDDLISPDRQKLASIGVHGEIVETPGHSPDSISLLMDGGAAFIGDLPLPDASTPDQIGLVRKSWKNLLVKGAKTFYHSHTGLIPARQIPTDLFH